MIETFERIYSFLKHDVVNDSTIFRTIAVCLLMLCFFYDIIKIVDNIAIDMNLSETKANDCYLSVKKQGKFNNEYW